MRTVIATFRKDLGFAARVLWKNPGFTLLAVLVLAFGIGGSAAMFSIVDAVLIRPLPYPGPEMLVALLETHEKMGKQSVSWWDFLDWQKQSQSMQQMAAIQSTIFILTGNGDPERLIGANVSATFFPVLGISPSLGQVFGAEADRSGTDRVVVVSYSLWKRKLNADLGVLGKNLTLNGHPYRVVAVLPPAFQFTQQLDIYAPIWLSSGEMGGRGSHPNLMVVGRMRDGIGLEQVRNEMSVIGTRLAQQYPATNSGESILVQPLTEVITGALAKPLLLLMGAVILVLFIACANVANLLLVRAASKNEKSASVEPSERLVYESWPSSLRKACFWRSWVLWPA